MGASSARRSFACTSASPADTQVIASAVASLLQPGDVVLLIGELGAGKTVFAQSIGRSLASPDALTSPTFTIMTQHSALVAGHPATLLHLDAYRLDGPAAMEDIGVLELIDDGAIALVEWGDIVSSAFGADALAIELRSTGDSERLIVVSADRSGLWDERIVGLEAALADRRVRC